MQNKLPVTGQNSRLFVVVSPGRVVCLFVYADYEQNTSFSKHVVYPLPSNFQISDIDHIIKDIVVTWGGLFGLNLRSDETGIINSLYFDAKPIGGSDLIVDSRYFEDGYSPTFQNMIVRQYGEKERLDSAIKYMRTYNPTDLVWVVLDWDNLFVYSIKRLGGSQSVDVDIKEFKISSDVTSKSILEQIESVIGVHIESENIKNTLSNVLTREITTSKSAEIWDVLRSFVTATLIKIKDPVLKNFGMKSEDPHLVITGGLASVMSPETLFISVIDGLQLRGRYRVILDSQLRSIVAQTAIGSRDFACPLKELYFDRFLYLSSETENKAKFGDPAFTGRVETTNEEGEIKEREIMGQVGQFHTLGLGKTGTIQIRPARSVYFPNLPKKGPNLLASFSQIDSKGVIDCRKIPVVYGPDENANLERIRMWINGLKLNNN